MEPMFQRGAGPVSGDSRVLEPRRENGQPFPSVPMVMDPPGLRHTGHPGGLREPASTLSAPDTISIDRSHMPPFSIIKRAYFQRVGSVNETVLN